MTSPFQQAADSIRALSAAMAAFDERRRQELTAQRLAREEAEADRRARWEAMTPEQQRESAREAMARFSASCRELGEVARRYRLRAEARRG